ncbi:MAG: hydrogenase iron-sulfur subunit [Desulfobacterales bacterium]|nr:hydrogenase iron-sulfur subunit [Desulfobacterales bacterium]
MRLGIFLSKCRGVVEKSIDLESLSREYENQGIVKSYEDFYDAEEFDTLLDDVAQSEVDAMVLAGDSPLAYRRSRKGSYLFKCLVEKGINPSKVEVVNLKNMVALPHEASHNDLQTKAKLLIDVGIAKVTHSGQSSLVEIAPRKAVAVIGANTSSIAAAQHLLDAGFKVFLVHKGSRIQVPPEEVPHVNAALIFVTRHPRFQLIKNAKPIDFYGYPGDYTLRLDTGAEELDLSVGAAVLSFESDLGLIKMSRATFRMDINADGTLAALDRTSARAMTRERGVFVIDIPAQAKENIDQKFLAADSAAAQVIHLLNRKEIYHQVTVSQVRAELCGGCGACVKTCMFNAVTLSGADNVSVIDPRRCRGCGNCVTACPAGARDLVTSPSAYLFNAVDILGRFKPEGDKPLVLLLACEGCGYESLDRSSQEGLTWPVGMMPLSVVCGGQIDMQLIMHAFTRGFDGVMMLICGEGCCHNIIGNVDLERRVNLFKEILFSRGIQEDRIHICTTCEREGRACIDEMGEFYRQLEAKFKDGEALAVNM